METIVINTPRITASRTDDGPRHSVKIVDRSHTPDRKRVGEQRATAILGVSLHDEADWVALDLEEIVYHQNGRIVRRIVSMTLDEETAPLLCAIIHERFGGTHP